jgi:4-amino-4-deoxy-L-arabinose transferase-like glycosyltransferase
VAILLLAAALALALLGQFYFFRRREYLWDGLVFHGLAALCFVLAWRSANPLPPRERVSRRLAKSLLAWLRDNHVPVGFLALGLFASFVAALQVRNRTPYQPALGASVLWLLGLVAVLAVAFWPAATRRPALPRSDASHWVGLLGPQSTLSLDAWLEIAAVVVLTLLALSLRVGALDQVPYTLGGDEAWHGLLARQVLKGEMRNPFSMGYLSMPTLFYWPLSWSLRLVGDNVVGLRLPAALIGTATVPLLFLLVRRLWGRRTAFLAATFMATYDYHIHFSRLGANNVWDPFLAVLIFWLLDRGLASRQGSAGSNPGESHQDLAESVSASTQYRRRRSFVLAGLMMGLGAFFYTGARLLPLMLAAYLIFFWLKRRLQRIPLPPNLAGHLALMVLAFFVAALPILAYAQAHPGEWNSRVNQVGIIQSGWLAQEPALTGKTTPAILAEQFLRAAGAFHVFPDRTTWYGADRPLLGFVAGLFAIFGLAWVFAHWRERRSFLVLLWFWAVIITGGMLTESPPSSQRLVLAIPPVILLVVMGIEQSTALLQRLLPIRPRSSESSRSSSTRGNDFGRSHRILWPNLALAFLILTLAFGNVRYYFIHFSPTHRYGSENGETATMMGHYLRTKATTTHAYFFGAPRIYWSFGTMAFMAPGVTGEDIVEPLTAPPHFATDGNEAVLLFLPERRGELSWVHQNYPDGRERAHYDASGQIRFIAYEFEP